MSFPMVKIIGPQGTEVQVELRIAVVGMIRLGLSRRQLQRAGAIGDPEPVLLQIHQGVAPGELHLNGLMI